MKELLLDMKAEVERAKALGQHALDVLVLARLLRRYDSILARSVPGQSPSSPSEEVGTGEAKTRASQAKPGAQSVGSTFWGEVGRAALPARFCGSF
jgi:hypothetical protein